MRLVSGLALAATAAIVFLACGETQEVARTESPTATASARPTVADPPEVSGAPTTGSLETYVSPGQEFAVEYPTDVTAKELPSTTKISDFVSAVEFYDATGLLRSSVYVFGNAQHLDLKEWVEDHDSAFFQGKVENITISRRPALLRRINFQGVLSPLAYVDIDGQVVSIKGLMDKDFDQIADHIRFDP